MKGVGDHGGAFGALGGGAQRAWALHVEMEGLERVLGSLILKKNGEDLGQLSV